MTTVLWVSLLCLQGYLLTHALDCADGGRDCTGGEVGEVKLRVQRHADPDRQRATHLRQAIQPGTYTAKGFPNTLIQADRSRRHLSASKKKHLGRKPRVGTFSLLRHNPSTPLQVVRARRHTGAVIPHMPPLKTVKQRTKRGASKNKKNTKPVVCS